MKINKLQINAFGNLENKEIELSENINVIYGKNEAGKSTLLKFIVDSLYGISKNKRGKEFSDYEKFKPWKTEEFSGKISYTLDNGKKYEVFRDFNKKNPKIYDEELNDISKEFTIDKTYGNQFFVEQTKIDEDTFLSTLASLQQEVRLGKQEQNTLVQKIANLAGTGDDNVSYKKAIEKINKRQVEEIGTSRTQGRPLNVVKDEKFKLQDEIGELEGYKDKQYEIEELRQNLEEKVKQNGEKLKLIKELKSLEEKENIEKQKIALNENIINNNKQKIEELKVNKNNLEDTLNKIEIPKETINKVKTNNSKNIIYIILIILSIILAIVLRNNLVVLTSMMGIFVVSLILLVSTIIKNNKKILEENNNRFEEINNKKQEKINIENEIEKLNSQIELLIKNNDEQALEIQKANEKLNLEIEIQKQNIIQKYKNIDINYSNLSYELDNMESNINKAKLEIHSLELDKNSIMPKLEKLASLEETLEELNEKEKSLLKDNDAIELAKQVLEIAYTKMKENVTPKFTKELSRNIEKISNGKYKNVRINDEQGIIVEKENGEYISSEKLSTGTIDQLYIALRFGAIKELSNENMPIILDEAFAYYDEERLCNILKYLREEYKDNQIIIFTCTNREKEILEKQNIPYKLITM